MPSNFVDLKQAAEMLGVTPDELVEMRSQGEIFGFRDGSSWKFKMDELERVAQERGGQLSGGGAGEQAAGEQAADEQADEQAAGESGELDLSKPLFGDSGELAEDDDDGSSIGELMAVDDVDLEPDDEADSLLVSDDAPLAGDSGGGSTIIGDSSPDSDLTLASEDDENVLGSEPTLAGSGISGGSSILGGDMDGDQQGADEGGSGVHLVAAEDGSDVSIVPDSDELLQGPAGSGVAADASDSPGTGELELTSGSGTGDLDVADDSGGELELSAGSGTGDLELDLDSGSLQLDDELEEDDDLVLGDSGAGSDVTLGTGDTGINLTSPSDSGLSLEDEPAELGTPASSLELPEDDEEISLDDEEADPDAATQLKQDEEFLLSPGDAMDDDDSGSQVIALEDSAAFDQDAATMLGEESFQQPEAEGQQAPMQQAPMQQGPAAMAPGATAPMSAPGAAAAAPAGAPEAPYSIWNVLALMLITGILGLSGMLMMDVVRNMWSWEATDGPVSTSLMDGLLTALKLK